MHQSLLAADLPQHADTAGGEPEGVRGQLGAGAVQGDESLLDILLLAYGAEPVRDVAGTRAGVAAAGGGGKHGHQTTLLQLFYTFDRAHMCTKSEFITLQTLHSQYNNPYHLKT